MDYVPGREPSRTGRDSLTGGTPTDLPALSHDLRPPCPMDGAVDAPASRQVLIGGVDNGVRRDLCDVTPYEPQDTAGYALFHCNSLCKNCLEIPRRRLRLGTKIRPPDALDQLILLLEYQATESQQTGVAPLHVVEK